jgi:hypothetical protein
MDKNDGLRHSEYWQERAEEARARAEEMGDPEAKATMLNIAYLYDRWPNAPPRRKLPN